METVQAIVIAAIAALPPTLLAWAAVRQARAAADKTDELKVATAENTRITEETAVKTDENTVITERAMQEASETKVLAEDIKKTTDQVHVLTNSRLSQVLTDLMIANERIASLEALVQTLAVRASDGNGGRKGGR